VLLRANFLVLAVAFCAASPALAANSAMKFDQLVCRGLTDVQEATELVKGPKAEAWKAFSQARIQAGACKMYRGKGTVVIDEEREGFAYVRPPGDFECVWAPKTAITEFAGYVASKARAVSAPKLPGTGRGYGRKRSGLF
jgi:hypothetical protein